MRGFGDKQTTPMPFSESEALAKRGEQEHGTSNSIANGSGGVDPDEVKAIEEAVAKLPPERLQENPPPEPEAELAPAAAPAPKSSAAMKVLGPLLVLLFAAALIGGTLYIAGKL